MDPKLKHLMWHQFAILEAVNIIDGILLISEK